MKPHVSDAYCVPGALRTIIPFNPHDGQESYYYYRRFFNVINEVQRNLVTCPCSYSGLVADAKAHSQCFSGSPSDYVLQSHLLLPRANPQHKHLQHDFKEHLSNVYFAHKRGSLFLNEDSLAHRLITVFLDMVSSG